MIAQQSSYGTLGLGTPDFRVVLAGVIARVIAEALVVFVDVVLVGAASVVMIGVVDVVLAAVVDGSGSDVAMRKICFGETSILAVFQSRRRRHRMASLGEAVSSGSP
jgi:hypothetical protein